MGALILLSIAAFLIHSVIAQQYIVSDVYYENIGPVQSGCATSDDVLIGMVTTGSETPQIMPARSNNTLSREQGTAFRFQDQAQNSQVLTDALFHSLQSCLSFCRSYAFCTAVQYQIDCGAGPSCTYLTTAGSLTLTSAGTTAAANSCINGGGSSVYVKYCSEANKQAIISPVEDTTSAEAETSTTNTWVPWYPWVPCIKIDPDGETLTRRRYCDGNGCACPPEGTCTTTSGVMYQEETTSCNSTCTDTPQVYIDYCNTVYRSDQHGFVWNQCDPCKYKYCTLAQGNWVVQNVNCPRGTRYDTDSSVCVPAQSDEKCHNTPSLVRPTFCSKYEVTSDIRQYEENNMVHTCDVGYVFVNMPACSCVPGGGVSIPKQNVAAAILCTGTAYDAGGYIGSANPYPDGHKIQQSILGNNFVCDFGGPSSNFAAGLKLPGLKGMGEVLNPAVAFWFCDTGSETAKQILLTNRGRRVPYRIPVSPNVEFYVENNQLYFITPNLGTNALMISEIQNDTWYCVGAVFDHDATSKENITSLTIKIYLKEAGGSLTTPLTQSANSYTVSIHNKVMRVGHSPDGTDYFTGQIDTITFFYNELITEVMMDQFCAVPGDGY